jgi:nitroreductase/NAD-dependent dihydropyrimidine dehydrogenase PreA subunit
MSIITVDEVKCNKCGICVQACPALIIERGADKFPFIEDTKQKSCINCGHCESVCPEGALVHQLSEKAMAPFVQEKVTIDPSVLGPYFRNRRSIRKYLPKPIEKKVMEQIMDVVRYAPTASNSELNQWIVINDPKVIEQLAAGTIDGMRALMASNTGIAGRYNLQVIIDAYDNGIDRICRNAPCLVVSYSPANYQMGAKDAVIATTHLELLLPSFGLGGCWGGFLMMAFQNFPELKKIVGLDDSSTIHAVLMAGYPKYKYQQAPPRNKADVKWM